jgi:hypothetical protein
VELCVVYIKAFQTHPLGLCACDAVENGYNNHQSVVRRWLIVILKANGRCPVTRHAVTRLETGAIVLLDNSLDEIRSNWIGASLNIDQPIDNYPSIRYHTSRTIWQSSNMKEGVAIKEIHNVSASAKFFEQRSIFSVDLLVINEQCTIGFTVKLVGVLVFYSCRESGSLFACLPPYQLGYHYTLWCATVCIHCDQVETVE